VSISTYEKSVLFFLGWADLNIGSLGTLNAPFLRVEYPCQSS
jgi:hypothetical protein